MSLPPFANEPTFVAVCNQWHETNQCLYNFADWFDADNDFGQAYSAGWRFLAGGYDGGGPPRYLHVPELSVYWAFIKPEQRLKTTPTEFVEKVAGFLQEWARLGLSVQQLDAARALLNSTEQVRTCGGYAGTGKTRLLSHLQNALPSWRVCAYTGKAASILRRKDVPGWTIHASIYRSVWDGDKFVRWEKKSKKDLGCEGFLIDEASMVSKEIFSDLLSYDLPIIAVGDHGQLPPVGEDAGLMNEPHVRLEEVHRNAGPIAKFAEYLRKGGTAADWERAEGSPVHITEQAGAKSLYAADQIICAFNRTRVSLHKRFWPRPSGPQPGDRIVCLDNDMQVSVFNGQQGTLAAYNPLDGNLIFRYEDEAGQTREAIVPFDPDAWNNPKRQRKKQRAGMEVGFDYGWVITCHKAQGDEWGKVVVIEQRCDELWDHARWAYTAASRAKDSLIWQVA